MIKKTRDLIINDSCKNPPADSSLLKVSEGFLSNIIESLALDVQDPPLGFLAQNLYNLKTKCYIISPIFWEASHNEARIQAYGRDLSLSLEEAETLYQALADFLAEIHLELYFHTETEWILTADSLPSIQAKPLYLMQNQRMIPELRHLDSSLFWQKLLTEIQMFLKYLDFKRPGKPEINGVWIWGGAPFEHKVDKVILSDTKLLPFAKQLSDKAFPYSGDPNTLKKQQVLLLDKTDSNLNFKKTIRWFWNDQIYSWPKPKKFFGGLW